MVKRKLDGALDKSSADQQICKSGGTIYIHPVKNLDARA